MDNTLTGTPDTAPIATPGSRRIIDAPVRAFHWLLALCFIGAWVTGDSEELRYVHITLGYTLAGLLGFRVLYGLAGPRQARLANLWRRVAGFPAWARKVMSGAGSLADRRQGVNLLNGLLPIALLLTLVPALLSGVATHFEWTGDWMEEVHETLVNLALLLVLAHLALIAALSIMRRQNLALSMVTGRVPGNGPDLAKRNHAAIAVALLAAALAFWGWSWQQAPSAEEIAAMSGDDHDAATDDSAEEEGGDD